MYSFVKDIDTSRIKTDVEWKIIKGPESDYQTSTIKLDTVFGLKCEFCRLIKLPPNGFIPRHSDNGGRKESVNTYHAVIQTNDDCINISYADIHQRIHLPKDTLWLFDTWPEHESFNFGSTDRIHLVIESHD